MKKNDLYFAFISFIIIAPFLPFPFLSGFQKEFLFNKEMWVYTGFLKFALLATMGETIGLRIKTGSYNAPGFGLVPRAIVWGVLGVIISAMFTVFSKGVPAFLAEACKLESAIESMKQTDVIAAFENGLGWTRVLTAFSISLFLNLIFAPVFMTFHKITDTHITDNGGTLGGFLRPIRFGRIFPRVNWFVQWDFVFKRTIPFFWIPAHTITFMLPAEYRVVFAALLGIVLGVFMSLASLKGNVK